MSRTGTGGGIAAQFLVTASSAGRWERVTPFLANRSGIQVIWTGTTNGTAVKLQGALTTGSTAPVTIALRRSSQGTAFVASTVAQVVSYVRAFSSAGVLSATKTARVFLAGYA